MSLARRGLLKGIVGGAVVAGVVGRERGAADIAWNPPPLPYPSNGGLMQAGMSAVDAARMAAVQLAEANRQREEQRIDREIENLQRLQSVSSAFIAYRTRQLWAEKNTLWDTFRKAMDYA